jgi:zinc D-Ala-D-Ala carboxypeptidase
LTQLTPHFADTELGVVGVDPRIIQNATTLCEVLLEPIRAQFGPVAVHDGYRDPAHNARVGGAENSQHLYLEGNSAADISTALDCRSVFDWVRLNSGLPFDQLILETNPQGISSTVHISYNCGGTQRREALTGMTNGLSGYTEMYVAPVAA